jgi:hypothetical protein
VYELCKNGESLLQEFIDKIERDEILFDKVARALSIGEHSSNGLLLPKTNSDSSTMKNYLVNYMKLKLALSGCFIP